MSKILFQIIQNRYHLQREIVSGLGSAKKGLYVDKKTRKTIFVKIDNRRTSLKREYVCHRFFYEQSKKLAQTEVVIPKPLKIVDVDNWCALLFEYFSTTRTLFSADVETRVDVYLKVLKFLQRVNETSGVRKGIPVLKRPPAYQLLTLPYFLLRNLVLYPSHKHLFVRSFRTIMRYSQDWLKLPSDWVCHGDINIGNVLLFGNRVVLLDFARGAISHRFYDFSIALNSTWFQAGFHELFWKKIVDKFRLGKNEQILLKTFIAFNLMQRMSKRYSNPHQERFYLRRLEKILIHL